MKTDTIVMEHLRKAAQAMVAPSVLAAMLPGVEIRVYEGINTRWYATVLLDRDTWKRTDIPDVHSLRESDRGKWWYDVSGKSRATTDVLLTELLTTLAATRLAQSLAVLVEGLPHKAQT